MITSRHLWQVPAARVWSHARKRNLDACLYHRGRAKYAERWLLSALSARDRLKRLVVWPSIMVGVAVENIADGVEKTPLWRMIGDVAASEGVELFDIEFPRDGGASGRSGVVRVYITKPACAATSAAEEATGRRDSVTFEDCVRVTKRLLDIDEKDAFVPSSCVLEVSSPGINRTLRLPEHFSGAVGERVRVKFRNPQNAYQVVTGAVSACCDGVLEIDSEEKREKVLIPLNDVKEARVDFKF